MLGHKGKSSDFRGACARPTCWDIKYTHIHIIVVLEEEREKGPEKIFEEIIAGNFPNMGKEIVT